MTTFVRRSAAGMLTTALVFLAAGCSRKGAAGPLIDAACHGNVARCEQLVKRGFAVDATDSEGNTALDWAVYYCKVDVVLKLVELGANVNHANDWHFEPLEYTASPLRGRSLHGTQEERNEIARILIQHGANVNHAIGNGRAIGSGQPVLHFAAADRNAGLVRILLEAGANRNAKSNQGYTPLDVAKSPNYAPNDEVIRAFEAR